MGGKKNGALWYHRSTEGGRLGAFAELPGVKCGSGRFAKAWRSDNSGVRGFDDWQGGGLGDDGVSGLAGCCVQLWADLGGGMG